MCKGLLWFELLCGLRYIVKRHHDMHSLLQVNDKIQGFQHLLLFFWIKFSHQIPSSLVVRISHHLMVDGFGNETATIVFDTFCPLS